MDTKRYLACITCNETVGRQVERDLTETLAGLGVVATGLSFPALTEGYQWKLHQIALDDADFCVFLVGSEYGPLSASGVGFLHRAYAHAQASGKPILVVRCDALSTPRDAVDTRRRDGMLAEMAQHSGVTTLEDPKELRATVEQFVDELIASDSIKGWQPVGLWSSPEDMQTHLLEQIEQLKQKLDDQRLGRVSHRQHEPAPPELSYRVKVFRDGNLTPRHYAFTLDWMRLFQLVAPLLTEPRRESDWKSQLEERLLQLAEPELRQAHPRAHGFVEFRLDGVVFDRIKQHFRRKGWLFQVQGIWQLSAVGEAEWLDLSDSS